MRKATDEQKAAAQAKREKFQELVNTVAAMTDEQRAALAEKIMITTAEGHTLSVFNNVLLASQRADVTIVGGFNQWIKAGRCVRKGEHGLSMFAPRMVKGESDDPRCAGFNMVYVFDVSQTDPLPAEAGAAQGA